MNLKQFEMDDVGVLHLKDANDEPMYAPGEDGKPDESKPIQVHLWGPGSQQYARAAHARGLRYVGLLNAKGGKPKETAEEATLSTAKFLTACTKRWDNVESDTGATGDELSMEIYTNPRLMFIREQVGPFVANTANFTKGSSQP